MGKALLISVGGSPSPIIKSINRFKPQYIIFFASKGSESMISQIRRNITYDYKADDKIVVNDGEDLTASYSVLREKLPEILKRWRIKPSQLLVDYTGGTKSMSAAMVLSTIDNCRKYIYIGGKKRTKQGLGIVIEGEERTLILTNPWNRYAVELKKQATFLFNQCHFDICVQVLSKAEKMVDKSEKRYYRMWKEIVEGYAYWDKFMHKVAKNKLYRGKSEMGILVGAQPELKRFLRQLSKNCKFLSEMDDKKLFLDLLANAKRRAEVERKYDDAVARLYRALEKLAQMELKNLGINTSNVKETQIPETIREEFVKKYKTKDKDGKEVIRLGLFADYKLLKELNHPLGDKFFEVRNGEEKTQKDIEAVLNVRNNSILAHGDVPVKAEHYHRLFQKILEFSNTKESDIPVFPQIEIP